MEYLDGYLPLSMKIPEIKRMVAGNKKKQSDINHKINLLISLEVRRLHQLGYYHNDLHTGNIMINTDELYATQDPTDLMNTGKVMLIDFGRVLLKDHPKLPRVCRSKLTADVCINREFIFSKYSFELKTIDECVELMSKMQEIGETRKMAICSALGIKDCDGRSLSLIVNNELSKSGLLIGGAHTPNSSKLLNSTNNSKQQIDPLLLRQVFINSLRQTDTYEQLYKYLNSHLQTNKKHGQNSKKNTIKLKHNKGLSKQRLVLRLEPPSISVMTGGKTRKNCKTIKCRMVPTTLNYSRV